MGGVITTRRFSVASTEVQVSVLLELAGITPTPAELEQLVADFPALKAQVERLWALDLGYTAPSMVFRAAEYAGAMEVAR